MTSPVLICGLGKVGGRVLAHLASAGVPVAVVSLGPPPSTLPPGVAYTEGDCRRPDVLEAAGIRTCRGVVIVTSDELVNISAAFAARRLTDARIVVRMFNQGLVARLGSAVKNTVALSVSGLTAPLLAAMAMTGDALGAFTANGVRMQVADVPVAEGSDLIGKKVSDVATDRGLLAVAHGGRLWGEIPADAVLRAGDVLTAAGPPALLAPLAGAGRGDPLANVRWAGWVRRQLRTARRTLFGVDRPVKLAGAGLLLTLFVSTLVFRQAGESWAEGLYHTVSIVATGSDLNANSRGPTVMVFVSLLKIAGAALVAVFTAILTQYFIRVRLGGALEVRRIPDGGHVVVCGLGNVGFRCVEELVRLGQPVVAVEKVNDNPFAPTVRRMGVPVVIGDAAVPEVLKQVRADAARAVIAATNDELANLEIALLVRELNPKQRVVVRLTDPQFAEAVRAAADVKNAVSVPSLAAPAFAAALLGDRVQALFTAAGKTVAAVDVVVKSVDPRLCGKTAAEAAAAFGFLPVTAPEGPLADGATLTVLLAVADVQKLLAEHPPSA